jgi:D-xylose transport system substrate-binding protein
VTVFKDFRLQAPAAAEIAAAVLKGEKPTNINSSVNNGQVDVQSVMLPVVPIDQSNVKTLVTNGWIETQLGGIDKVMTGLPESARKYLQ